jgi:hypothetical protein
MSSVVVKDEKARAEEALKNVNEAFAGDKVVLNLRTVYFSCVTTGPVRTAILPLSFTPEHH